MPIMTVYAITETQTKALLMLTMTVSAITEIQKIAITADAKTAAAEIAEDKNI